MRTKVLRTSLLTLALVAVVLMTGTSVPAQGRPEFRAVPLSCDDAQLVAQQALRFTQTYMHIVGGTPEVIWSGLVPDSSGWGVPCVTAGENSVWLVVLRGDIDVCGAWPGSCYGDPGHNYVDYFFDLQTGFPFGMAGEAQPDILAGVLDPSKLPVLPEPPVPMGSTLPRGAIAPTVMPTATPQASALP